MKDQIDNLIQESKKFEITTKEELEKFRLKFLVKKGLVNNLFQEFRLLVGDEKKLWGKEVNIAKQKVETIFLEAQMKIGGENSSQKEEQELPGYYSETGSRHPISFVVDEMSQIFERLFYS